jgi:hypothetical protein
MQEFDQAYDRFGDEPAAVVLDIAAQAAEGVVELRDLAQQIERLASAMNPEE